MKKKLKIRKITELVNRVGGEDNPCLGYWFEEDCPGDGGGDFEFDGGGGGDAGGVGGGVGPTCPSSYGGDSVRCGCWKQSVNGYCKWYCKKDVCGEVPFTNIDLCICSWSNNVPCGDCQW